MGATLNFSRRFFRKEVRSGHLIPLEDALENAKKMLQEERNITFVKGTTEELPFEDDFFDLVVSLVLLHHLQGLERGLQEMLRVLSKKGKLILIDWNPEAHVLPFASRHRKEDFFSAEIVYSDARIFEHPRSKHEKVSVLVYY